MDRSWDDFFKLADAAGVPVDFMAERCSDLARVLAAAMAIYPDAARALDLINHQPIDAFGGHTLRQVAEEGRADDAIAYLQSIAAGFVG